MGRLIVRITAALALLLGVVGGVEASVREQPPLAEVVESRLLQVAAVAQSSGAQSALRRAGQLGLTVTEERVRVVFEAPGGAARVRTAVDAVAGVVEAEREGLVQALVPPGAVGSLPILSGAYLRAPLTPRPAAIAGEGVAFTGANRWHGAGLTGAGVDIAVIDAGFAGLAARQSEGEVPGSALLVDRCPGRWGSTDHGVAVAEIIHEVAPGARLHLICVGTEVELMQALEYVSANRIPIVNHSMSWFGSSRGDGQGPPGTPEHMVAQARAAGILWVNAAGNAGEKHWSGVFTDGDGDSRHEFAPGDEQNRILVNSGRHFCAVLKWDEWPATDEDYDLVLRSVTDDLILANSRTAQTGSQSPREELCWQNGFGAAMEIYLEITRARGTGSPRLDLYSTMSGRFQHKVPEGSIVEPATSPAVLAVGAVCVLNGVLEAYSSRGPTIDGRSKPDLVAPATVTGATYGRNVDCEPLTAGGFRGTSASAPHVAAAASLLAQHRPELDTEGLADALLAHTVDLQPPGPDLLHGAGSLVLRQLTPLVVTAPPVTGVRYAMLSGSVDTRGLPTSYVLEYGPTGSELRTATQSVASAWAPTPVSFTLEDLPPGTPLRYRLVATNAFGTTAGPVVTTSTLAPSAPSVAATANAGERSATVTATVEPRGEPTSAYVEYGQSSGLGSRSPGVDAGRGVTAVSLQIELAELEPGTSYQYRVVTTNTTGTTSTTGSFTTQRPPPPPPPPPPPAPPAPIGAGPGTKSGDGPGAVKPPARSSGVQPLRIARLAKPTIVIRRGVAKLRASFRLNRTAQVTLTLLDTNGRRVRLLAGTTLRGRPSGKAGRALQRSLPAGRTEAVLRVSAAATRSPLRLILVARGASGERTTLVITVRR